MNRVEDSEDILPSWDKSLGNYSTQGVNFLFSLDTIKFYNEGYGPTFGGGHDLYIANSCMGNKNSYTNKSSYERSSAYELNSGIYQFKVLDYEVFRI